MTHENMRKVTEEGIRLGWISPPAKKKPSSEAGKKKYAKEKQRRENLIHIMGWGKSKTS